MVRNVKHDRTISSLEDISSAHDRGRAKMLALADISTMETTGWKKRLAAAIEADGRSDRALSMESGNGKGYVHSILKEGKDPSITNLTRLCDTLGVSLTHILYGFDITPETEKLLRAVGQHPETLPHLLAILDAKEIGGA